MTALDAGLSAALPGFRTRPLGGAVWYLVAAAVFALCWLAKDIGWLRAFPDGWTLPFSDWLNGFMGWFIERFRWIFRWFSGVLDVPFEGVVWVLNATPWPIVAGLCGLVAHAAGGPRLALFTLLSFLYILIVGYWTESMNTLALVALSVPLAILVGFGLGVAAYASKRGERIVMPVLDLLQTVPAFAYLIPILLLYGIGPVVGLIASVLYAAPPMARNTILGLRRVSPEIVESGRMSGATAGQLFWRVRVPTALPQLLMGVNQSTMAALSMVIIAAVIGGSEDIGVAVLHAIQKADFGVSLVAGLVIALMAMNLDRITHGFAARSGTAVHEDRSLQHLWRYWIMAAGLVAGIHALKPVFPALQSWPETWHWTPAGPLNDFIEWVVVRFGGWLEAIKNAAFFYIMLPMKIGLARTVSPHSWGFELTPAMALGYAAGTAALSALTAWRRSLAAGGGVALAGVILWFGMTGTPWLALLLVIVTLAWWTRGRGLALFALVGLSFLIVAGVWSKVALSIYLCGAAVLISFALGSLIGIWAASSETVSRIVRPVNDTLQTMPLFVLLIPAVMLFRIGEFTALVAIVLYAIVPAIRYTEHALRNVPHDVVEAGEAMGCTPLQLLWQVKLPQAMPGILLGLNQTIMYAIAMLVIAALVGTSGLGQQVYIGLGDGDFGVGMVAGIGMAIVAIIADRMTQPESART